MVELGAIKGATTPTEYGYPPGYKPTLIEEQIKIIAGFCGLRRRKAFKIAKELQKTTLPEGTELFAFPFFSAVGTGGGYSSAANFFIKMFEKKGKGYSFIKPTLTEVQVLRHKKTNDKLKELAQRQKSDILVAPVQTGIRYSGLSATTAEERFKENEFGLGMFEIGCMLLANPGRLQSSADLRIDCVSDPLRKDGKCFIPCFGIDHQQGNLTLGMHSPRSASRQYGVASAFMI